MQSANAPIGVLDAGFGGYTVVKELQALLPHEDIIFYGEGANQPYGNRSQAEILHLTRQCLRFLEKKQVKAVAIACNTISTLIDEYQKDFDFPIFSIVRAGSDDVVSMAPEKVVVLSTSFTAKTDCYAHYIAPQNPEIQVIAQGCPWLARIIEDGDFDQQRLDKELTETLGVAAAAHPDADALVYGCTHFPLVKPNIQRLYPQFTRFINPAISQAKRIESHLASEKLLKTQGEGSFQVYTTSDCEVYCRMTAVLGLNPPQSVALVPPPTTLLVENG